MTFVIRGNPEGLRTSAAFSVSTCLHVALLLWLILAAGMAPPERPRSLYDQVIRPHETHLIWYNLRDRLPEVKPSTGTAPARKQRALKKFNQEIAVGPKELPKPPQLIQMPAPEISLPKPLPLPNVVSASPLPRPVRAFTAPPDAPRPQPQPVAPLPEAPKMNLAAQPKDLTIDVAGPRPRALPFTPPEARKTEVALPVLPAAPVLETGGGGMAMPRVPKGFVAPPSRRAASAAAPSAEAALAGDDTAVVNTAGQPADASLVIVGLNPANTTHIPPPPGSHTAGFSAGPNPRSAGSDSSAGDAVLVVPGLSAHGGAKENQPSLVAALAPMTRERMAAMLGAPGVRTPVPAAEPAGARVVPAPDPRLAGRVVYSVAIQMPNITSFSGSWLVWFAEHRPVPGAPPMEISAPVPLRKVDPKYIQAAADEKVQGVIRLFAVIRKTGFVDSVELLQGLDRRLDQSAAEALVKWQFEPAHRDGTPIDVDAVFDIPFRLAPKITK